MIVCTTLLRQLSLYLIVCLSLACSPVPQQRNEQAAWREAPQLNALFSQAGIDGTFVLYDSERNLVYGCNRQRAETRYQPASTFKILNSLIAFETGVVKNTEHVLPYGGEPQTVKAWGDMNIREAIAISNMPIYQGIARRIGQQRMRDFVQRVGYGNADIGNTVDTFWLEGPLAVSAMEQVHFLHALLQGQLPFSEQSLVMMLSIMPRETLPDQSEMLFKTGWARSTQLDVGWLIGWIRLNGKAYPFALNCDMPRMEAAALRLTLTRSALQTLMKSNLVTP